MDRKSLSRAYWSFALCLLSAGASAQTQTMSATVHYQTRIVDSWHQGGLYNVSIPHVGGIPDVANTTATTSNKCVAAGQGDGVVNVDDLICAFWGGGDPARRVGSIAISYWNPQDCLYRSRVGSKSPIAGVIFSGVAYPLDRNIGYLITLSYSQSNPPGQPQPPGQDFDYTWVDQCDPAFQPVTIAGDACSLGIAYLHLPYATDVEDANEVLCGQRGVDWFDVDTDGDPDDCPNGLFDGAHALSVRSYDNVTRQWSIRGVMRPFLSTTPYFFGPNIAFSPGDSPVLSISPSQEPRTWAPATTCGGSQ